MYVHAMKNLSSAVRQLAERHARLQARANELELQIAEMQAQRTRVVAEIAAAALLLTKLDRRVDPDSIEPIDSRTGRYGKRGALIEAIVEFLRAEGSEWTSTGELSLLLRRAFDLSFTT